MAERIVLIDGARTPFLKSGGDYMDLMSYELGKFAIEGLLKKSKISATEVGYVVMGTTISNVKTGNVAREAAITAGIPFSAPCHTVTMACISANQAIVSAANVIKEGLADVVIAGGVDSVSDAPILFNRPMRKKLFKSQKLKGIADYFRFALSLRLKDFVPEAPAVAEFLTNRTMGLDCDLMAQRWNISRLEQDEFALRSHHLAAQAGQNGHLKNEIVPVEINGKTIDTDNGYRADTTLEKISKLSPAFVKDGKGTVTAANASFLTDGAAAVLLMTEKKAKDLGLKPKAILHEYTFTGQRLEDELLLGPAYAISQLLHRKQISIHDIDVFELHEAFAGQMVANLKCLASDDFAKKNLGYEKAVGQIPMEKLNCWGGSLSLGHPFGATGARLLTTAANRLQEENGRFALIAACAAGAHGHAMIIEKWNN